MPNIFINTDRTVDRSIVAGINQPQRESLFGALVAGSVYDFNLYFVRNDGTYDPASGDAGASVEFGISTLGTAQSGTFTMGDGTDTTSAIQYGASALTVQTALNALNTNTGPFGDTVIVTKLADFQYQIAFNTAGAKSVLSASNVSLFPESTPAASIAVAGTASTKAQQMLLITRQPAVYQSSWSTISNGFTGTVSLNSTRLLQSILVDSGMPFFVQIDLNGQTVAREVVTIEKSAIPESAFSAQGLASLLDLFAANPNSNGNFSSATWDSALGIGTAAYQDTSFFEQTANKNQPNGYPGLNSAGLIDSAVFPAFFVTGGTEFSQVFSGDYVSGGSIT